MRTSLLLALALLVPACKDASEGEKGCNDFVDAFATRAEECGFDYDSNRDNFENVLGGCGRFDSLRDEAALYGQCLPWIDSLTCAQIDDSSTVLHVSCQMQFEDTKDRLGSDMPMSTMP